MNAGTRSHAGGPGATLGEGNTPLVASARIGPERGAGRLFFKLESCNPTASYKDRFVAAEVTRILRSGARACIATSSGNTGASLAAYCARYGLLCLIIVNADAPAGKLAQMQAHGARVIRIPGFVSDPAITNAVFRQLEELAESRNVPFVISAYRYCPEGMSGVESIAHELASQAPDVEHVFVPVGGGGLYTAVVQGFQSAGRVPRIHAVQPEGCSTVAASFARGDQEVRPVISTTRVSGLSVPFDIDAGRALERLRACGGHAFEVSDDAIFAAQAMLMQDGIYSEPAGAATLAGWLRAIEQRVVHPEDPAICLVTGHGSKDPLSVDAIARQYPAVDTAGDRVGACLDELLRRLA
jgi:threonine synthase